MADDKIGAGRERKITGAPQTEPGGIGEVLHRGGAGRRDVEDARIMQRVLEAQPGLALLRRFLLAAFPLVAGGIGHRVGFVEDDDAIETCPGPRAGVAAEPVDDLLNPARLVALAPACAGLRRW